MKIETKGKFNVRDVYLGGRRQPDEGEFEANVSFDVHYKCAKKVRYEFEGGFVVLFKIHAKHRIAANDPIRDRLSDGFDKDFDAEQIRYRRAYASQKLPVWKQGEWKGNMDTELSCETKSFSVGPMRMAIIAGTRSATAMAEGIEAALESVTQTFDLSWKVDSELVQTPLLEFSATVNTKSTGPTGDSKGRSQTFVGHPMLGARQGLPVAELLPGATTVIDTGAGQNSVTLPPGWDMVR